MTRKQSAQAKRGSRFRWRISDESAEVVQNRKLDLIVRRAERPKKENTKPCELTKECN